MILAYHAVFSTYGFWLPNDPRGSWSIYVASPALCQFGPATKVQTRRSRAHVAHDRAARMAAKQALKYPPVIFSGAQAQSVGRGFGAVTRRLGYSIYACAIMPDHVHLVLGQHQSAVEQQVRLLKAGASSALLEDDRHPLAQHVIPGETVPSVWCRGLWKKYLDHPAAVASAIAYVRDNPVKEGKHRQNWSFVTRFVG